MGESMGNCSINGEIGTNTDPNNHKPNLIDFTVAQHPSKIVLNHGIKDGKHGHDSANGDQYFCSGK